MKDVGEWFLNVYVFELWSFVLIVGDEETMKSFNAGRLGRIAE
jgi:hypothetical protein